MEPDVKTEGTSGRAESREPMDRGDDKEKEERKGPDSCSSALRQRTRWPGERGPLTEGQRDTCGRQNLFLTNVQTHTHTQLRSVLYVLAQPLAPNIDGMFDCPPLVPLRHDVTPTKCRLF